MTRILNSNWFYSQLTESQPHKILNMIRRNTAETALGYFGFDRTDYGDPASTTKWWSPFAEERIRDRDVERI